MFEQGYFGLFDTLSESPSTLTSETTPKTDLPVETVPPFETTPSLKDPIGDKYDTDPGADGTTGDSTNDYDYTSEENGGSSQGVNESETIETTPKEDIIDFGSSETSNETTPEDYTTDYEYTTPVTEEPTTTAAPPLPNFDPPNYKYKVLKNYSEDYFTPSVFLFVGLVIIFLTFGFHYYMDSKEKERQVVTGARFKPDRKKKAEDSSKSMTPTLKSGKSPTPKDSPIKPVPTKAPNSPKT